MPATHALVEKLSCLFDLAPEESAALHALPSRLVRLAGDEEIHRAGDCPTSCFVVLDGLVCSSKWIEDGKRQIMSFYVAGDLPDIRTLHLGVIDCDVTAVGPCQLAVIEHGDLQALCDAHPRIASALWRCTLVVGSVYREWIVNIGHRSALVRLAHLMCELMTRLEAVGHARDRICNLPLTQIHLSQATGLSAVHVNRSLQELRKRGLITFGGGRLTIPDWDGLTRLAYFRPDYLYLPQARRRAA
ncbi:Crp/Fnr family transcriptional regulator [Rubellimicrobium roseum]|uniref:Crp/Fnr family transcriptional regulator n=1 Tax=Rubellimicrobium roseum TaxID=687525 RepID=UPI001C3F1C2F|nr:Crp/Fnr family transcriptional regulator [Rubellimicrobium roseum]